MVAGGDDPRQVVRGERLCAVDANFFLIHDSIYSNIIYNSGIALSYFRHDQVSFPYPHPPPQTQSAHFSIYSLFITIIYIIPYSPFPSLILLPNPYYYMLINRVISPPLLFPLRYSLILHSDSIKLHFDNDIPDAKLHAKNFAK